MISLKMELNNDKFELFVLHIGYFSHSNWSCCVYCYNYMQMCITNFNCLILLLSSLLFVFINSCISCMFYPCLEFQFVFFDSCLLSNVLIGDASLLVIVYSLCLNVVFTATITFPFISEEDCTYCFDYYFVLFSYILYLWVFNHWTI